MAQQSAPQSARAEFEELASAGRLRWLTAVPSWLTSMVVHLILVLVMALCTFPQIQQSQLDTLVATTLDQQPDLGDQQSMLDQAEDLRMQPLEQLESLQSASATQPDVTQIYQRQTASTALPPLREFGVQTAPLQDLLGEVGEAPSSGLEGRGEGNKQALLARYGGTEASEAAVTRGLAWLAEHQNADGSWSFDHSDGPCKGRCRDAGGFANARLGATGIALLPFLGAGITHRDGEYKKNVQMGLFYLSKHRRTTRNGAALTDAGRFYSHGIATIALCEAYAMTRDRELFPPAQQALDYISFAQDPLGGGWRYEPAQPGDTSVLGWQFMALHSGRMAYLRIPAKTMRGVHRFLDSDQIQYDDGAGYNYQHPSSLDNPSTTAIGLLCRMYLGWPRDTAALERGVRRLSEVGPSPTNIYFNYYATQVLHHYEGELWDKWNNVMREQLIKTQSRDGHEAGSWHFHPGPDWPPSGTREGGRLYCTAMSTMILEVYYRHMPLYQRKSLEQEPEGLTEQGAAR
jgi:hypothetical protein